jgi:hypothetical protein
VFFKYCIFLTTYNFWDTWEAPTRNSDKTWYRLTYLSNCSLFEIDTNPISLMPICHLNGIYNLISWFLRLFTLTLYWLIDWLLIQQPVGLCPLVYCHRVKLFTGVFFVHFLESHQWEAWVCSASEYCSQGRVHCAQSPSPFADWNPGYLCSSRHVNKSPRQKDSHVLSLSPSTMASSPKNTVWSIFRSAVLDSAVLAPSQPEGACILINRTQLWGTGKVIKKQNLTLYRPTT